MGLIKRDKVYKILQVEVPDGQGGVTYQRNDAGSYMCQVSYSDNPAEATDLGVNMEQILHIISPVSFVGEEDAPVPSGISGFSPTIDVLTETDTEYVLHITDKNKEYDTPNLKGEVGPQGEKGDTGADGESGVIISTVEPIDSKITVWINPEGESETKLVTEEDLQAAIVNFVTEEKVKELIQAALKA